MGYDSKGKPPGCPAPAPDFARATGMPKDRQVSGTGARRAPDSGQTKMPADQGGRTDDGKKG